MGLEIALTTDVDPTVFAHKQGAEILNPCIHIPALGHELILRVEFPVDLQEHAVGILIGQHRVFSRLGRDDLDGVTFVHAQSPLDDVEGMYSVAGQIAASEIAAEVPRYHVRRTAVTMKPAVERTPWRRAEPLVPIETFGYGFGGQAHIVAGSGEAYIDDLDLADGTLLDQSARLLEFGR